MWRDAFQKKHTARPTLTEQLMNVFIRDPV